MNLNEEPDEVTAAQASQTKAGSGLQRHRRSVALGRCQDGLREDQNQPMSAAPSGAERVSCPIRNVKGCGCDLLQGDGSSGKGRRWSRACVTPTSQR